MGVHVIPTRDAEGNLVQFQPPFKSKAVPGGTLYKRVEGAISVDIPANETRNIDIVISVGQAKFSGAEILNTDFGDVVDFTVHDTDTNTYSGLDPATVGANFQINKFGFAVVMPSGGYYKNTSEYDATLYQGMILRCTYTNNTGSTKKIGMNAELHEVRPNA